MSGTRSHPLETVLRMIDQEAPNPWHPYRVEGLDRKVLDQVLEVLWFQGLIQKARTSSAEEGPALVLTPLGQRTLSEPELLARLCEGRAIDPTSPAQVVRANLSQPPRIRAMYVIFAANLAVFLWGLAIASTKGVGQTFFVGFSNQRTIYDILHHTGSVVGFDLLNGEWWRLLTAGFNHSGVIHIGMNMYALYAVGSFVEQRFGWWRFLVIYFVSVWTGGCLAMAYQPGIMTLGASGGLFGVFTAVIAWLMLYGKYLPAGVRKSIWRTVILNIVILSVMSFVFSKMISHWGHLGGAIGGFVTCFVLHFQRFGPLFSRIAATLVLLTLPWLSWSYLDRERVTNKAWRNLEVIEFYNQDGKPIADIVYQTLRTTQKHLNPLIEQHALRRDPAKVEEALAAIAKRREGIEAELARLNASHYKMKSILEACEKGTEVLRGSAELCDVVSAYLRAGEKAKRADEKQVETQFGKVDDLENEWNTILKGFEKEVAP